MRVLQKFVRDRTGATAIEYALIAAGIAVVVMAAMPWLSAAILNVLGQATSAVG